MDYNFIHDLIREMKQEILSELVKPGWVLYEVEIKIVCSLKRCTIFLLLEMKWSLVTQIPSRQLVTDEAAGL